MPFVEAGPVVAKTKYSGSISVFDDGEGGSFPSGFSYQDQSSKFNTGWTAGFGAEYRVAKDIGFKLGYSYVNLGKKEYLNVNLGGIEESLGKKGFDLHIVKIGLTKYFN
jgi:opacity protein-like surface antigen